MAKVPRIDKPCPLSMAEQLGINGHCARCDKHVHALDGLDDAARMNLLASAKGPLCVSYRRSVPTAMVLGATLAAALSARTAKAGEDCDKAPPPMQSVEAGSNAPLIDLNKAYASAEDKDCVDIIIVGGVTSPADAEWIDDSDLPELPMRVEVEGEPADQPASDVSSKAR